MAIFAAPRSVTIATVYDGRALPTLRKTPQTHLALSYLSAFADLWCATISTADSSTDL